MNNVCLNLIKNKKLFFLLLSSFSLFAFNFKINNVNNQNIDVKNNFNLKFSKSNIGAFSHVENDTGWNVLASDDNISNYVKSYDTFTFPIFLKNYFHTSSGFRFFQYFGSDFFSTKDFLVNNKVTTREYYGEGWDMFGYFQQYVIISFKLVGNTIFFKSYGYIYSGWCFDFNVSLIDFNINKGSFFTFLNL